MDEQEKLYTVKDVAERFGVSHRTVLNWINDGEIAFYRVGRERGVIRIGEHHIQEYLETRQIKKAEMPS